MDSRRLNIGITKSVLKRFNVEFDDKGVSTAYATIGLQTEFGKEVAEHTVWKSSFLNGLEIGPQLEHVIMALGLELHRQAENHVTGLHGLIEEAKDKEAEKKETETLPL